MSDTLKTAIMAAALRMLEPLVKLLLEAGVGVGEFQQLAKRAYVRMARERDQQVRPNISRIAVQTGISRIEVSAILAESTATEIVAARGQHRGEAVLQGWWTDRDFREPDGPPLILPLRGSKKSFAALIKRYSGDPRPHTLLDELIRVRAIQMTPDGKVEALSRTVATARWDTDGVSAIGERVRDLLETLGHNLKHPSRPRYERFVVSESVDPRWVPLLTRDIGEQADAFLDGFLDSFNEPRYNVRPGKTPKDARRLGIVVYTIEEPVVIEPVATTAKSPSRRSA